MAQKKRLEWVDAVKGLLILYVILGHAIQETLKVRGIGFEDNLWRNIIYSFHMPAFMAMSGYLSFRPNSTKQSFQDLLHLIIKKAKQLLIPFAIWSIPLFIFYHNVEDIWDYILFPNKGYWFLWALFFIICLFSMVEISCKKLKINIEVPSFFVALCLIGCQMLSPNAKLFGYEYIAYYYIFYMIGYYANKYNNYFPQRNWIIWGLFTLWAIMAVFGAPKTLPFFLENITIIPFKLLLLFYRILTPIVFIIWMYAIAPKMTIRNNRIWNRLIEFGQISLGIYVTHMVIKNPLAKLLLEVAPTLAITIQIVLEFTILTALSYIVVRLLLKSDLLSRWLLGKW